MEPSIQDRIELWSGRNISKVFRHEIEKAVAAVVTAGLWLGSSSLVLGDGKLVMLKHLTSV